MLLLTGAAFLIVGMAALPVWGWIELRFSPVQRHYLPVYLNDSSVHCKATNRSTWLDREAGAQQAMGDRAAGRSGAGPGRGRSVRVVPAGPVARLDRTRVRLRKACTRRREIRDYLETNFYGGHSLLFLVLQPLELVAVGWMFWKYFERWRNNLARERGLHWDSHYRPNTLNQDLRLFAKQLAQEGRDVRLRSGDGSRPGQRTGRRRRSCRRGRGRFTVSGRASHALRSGCDETGTGLDDHDESRRRNTCSSPPRSWVFDKSKSANPA